MDTIFLSSTCYDLADVRSVLVNSFTSEGFNVIASDVTSSGFALFSGQNSVEICRTNVARSDIFLLILDRRYGPPVPTFEGKSATHVEYDVALERGIPILTFVRKAFVNDYRIWQKMTSANRTAAEVAEALGHVETKARGGSFEFVSLFAFFDLVRHANERGKNNWVEAFDAAHELSQLALRRVREILHEESLRIQNSLRSLVSSPLPISLSAEYVTKANAAIDQLTLTDAELRMLAVAASEHGIDVAPFVERMSDSPRTSLLSALAPALLQSDAGAATITRFKSAAITEVVCAWLDSQGELATCLAVSERLGFDADFFTDRLRTSLHELLWKTYRVGFAEFDEPAVELLDQKLASLRLIAGIGDARDIPAVLRCLVERGIPTTSGDPEHQSLGEPPGHIYYRHADEVVDAAKKTFMQLHQQGVCLLSALPRDWIARLRCSSLRINVARTLIAVCDHNTPDQHRSMVSTILQSNGDDELSDALTRECAEHGIDLETTLLDFLHGDPKLVSRSLNGLVWHATRQALPQLLSFVNTCGKEHLEAVAYVLRFLIDDSTRKPIVKAFRQRMLHLDGQDEEGTMCEIVSRLGTPELLPLLHISDSSSYRDWLAKDVRKVELERPSGLRRDKFFWIGRYGWSREEFASTENACIEEVRSIFRTRRRRVTKRPNV